MKKITFIAVFGIFLSTLTYAQGALSLNVWPPRVDLSLVPGESRTGLITVTNKGDNRARVLSYVTDLGMDKMGNLTYPEGGTLPFSCESWLLINPEDFTLSQGTSQQVRYTLKAPDNASGSYLASIFFHTKPEGKPQGSGSQLTVRVGTIFVINITGTGFKDGELTALSLNKFDDSNVAQIELGFKNKGNVLVRPKGTVEIQNESGWTVDKIVINEGNEAVLPYAERLMRISLSDIKPGKYKLITTVDYGGSEILSGEASVTLVAAEPARHNWPILQPKTQVKTSSRSSKTAAPAVKASPEEIKSLYNAASKQYISGDYQTALATWQKLLRLDPGNAAAKKNLEKTRTKLDALKKIKG